MGIKKHILVIPGDGIGPEVTTWGKAVLEQIGNNIIAGLVKPNEPDYFNHCGYFMVFGFMDQLAKTPQEKLLTNSY